MRILSVVRKHYYGSPKAIEPIYLYFTLQEMGHEVDTFDHYEMSQRLRTERTSGAVVNTCSADYQNVCHGTGGDCSSCRRTPGSVRVLGIFKTPTVRCQRSC
jgi:hypothetical protein